MYLSNCRRKTTSPLDVSQTGFRVALDTEERRVDKICEKEGIILKMFKGYYFKGGYSSGRRPRAARLPTKIEDFHSAPLALWLWAVLMLKIAPTNCAWCGE